MGLEIRSPDSKISGKKGHGENSDRLLKVQKSQEHRKIKENVSSLWDIL